MKRPRTLSYWGFVVLNGTGPYLAGYEVGQGTRTSTPLVEFDPENRTALTASGRPYRLIGTPDPDCGLATAIEVRYYDIEKSTIRSLTVDEAVEMITANGNEAYNRTLDEENALRRKYGLPGVVDESEIPGVSDVLSDLILPDPDDDELTAEEREGIAQLDTGLPMSRHAWESCGTIWVVISAPSSPPHRSRSASLASRSGPTTGSREVRR